MYVIITAFYYNHTIDAHLFLDGLVFFMWNLCTFGYNYKHVHCKHTCIYVVTYIVVLIGRTGLCSWVIGGVP